MGLCVSGRGVSGVVFCVSVWVGGFGEKRVGGERM